MAKGIKEHLTLKFEGSNPPIIGIFAKMVKGIILGLLIKVEQLVEHLTNDPKFKGSILLLLALGEYGKGC